MLLLLWLDVRKRMSVCVCVWECKSIWDKLTSLKLYVYVHINVFVLFIWTVHMRVLPSVETVGRSVGRYTCREKIYWRKIGFSFWMKFIRGSNEPPAILSMYLSFFFPHLQLSPSATLIVIAFAHALALSRSCLVCVCVHEIRWRWHLMHYHWIKQKKHTKNFIFN